MASVKIDKFCGIAPRLHPTLLPDGMAVEAHNCKLENGKLVPLRQPSFVDVDAHSTYFENGLSDIRDAQSLYCWKHTLSDGTVRTDFLAFPGRVYFAHGNIADDEYDRIFVTGETGVSFTTSNGAVVNDCPAVFLFDRESGEIIRHCIVKEPLDAPQAWRAVSPIGDGISYSYAYFFFSWYDQFGYESPVSAPSRNRDGGGSSYTDDPMKYTQGTIVEFLPVHMPEDAYGLRVYKTNAGNETDNIQFLKEFGISERNLVGSANFRVRLDDTQTGEALPEIASPPNDLVDMTFVPGNYYAGRQRSMPHTVLFSDVDNPTNWPTAYRYDVRDNVVKLAVTANSVFALTDGTPYVLSGTAPESMTVASLATPAACVSEKSVVVYRNVVYFASNEGLFAVTDGATSGTSCVNITDQYMTKEQWQALNPSSCLMAAYDNALHMFFARRDPQTGVVTNTAMIFDLTESANALTTHEEAATCLCTDDRTDDLYFVRKV